MSFWSDLLQVISSAGGNEAGVVAPSSTVGSDVVTSTPWGKFLTLAEGIWAAIADGKLWRSVGWLLLGLLLMLLGVSWWLGPSAAMGTPGGAALKRLT